MQSRPCRNLFLAHETCSQYLHAAMSSSYLVQPSRRRSHRLPSILFAAFGSLAVVAPLSVRAEEAFELSTVVITAESENDVLVQPPFLPPVEGTRILAGKKTSVLDLDALPAISSNNYRQALAKTPGLFLSEETTPLVSLGYRGLEPHRMQFTQVLKDGIPIHADQFGYPEAYYTPPLDTVDRIEFVRGGAALLYGPQPGGALNYVTHRPRADKAFSLGTTHIFGSDHLYSTFTYFDGTSGRLGYYGYYNHRQGDGFRNHNGAFNLNAGLFRLVLDEKSDSRWILTVETYAEEHGEPGGLTFAKGHGAVNYNTNRDAASRRFDAFELERHAASLTWEKDFSADTALTASVWASYYSRYSSRQRGGGFGTVPSGPDANTTSIELQEFYTQGLDARFRHHYVALGGTHTFSGGVQVFHSDSPRQDRRGEKENARTGKLRAESDRETWYVPVFIENRFAWGPFSITPGVRLENVWQSVNEKRNADKQAAGVPLGNSEEYDFVPLFGVGLAYELRPGVELYANASQSYRPKIFTQAVPTGGTALVPEDLDAGEAWQYDLGFRGNPAPWIIWDIGGFLLDFDNQIGSVALPGGRSTVGNVGRARHLGAELAFELDLIGALDAALGSTSRAEGLAKDGKQTAEPSLADRFGSLSIFANAMLLDAEFIGGPLESRTPQYAPDYLIRTGLIYRWKDRFKLALLGTFTDSSFADAANTPERFIPAFMVWDLTLEAKVYRDNVSVIAGINNLFDEDYYARVRDDGIDPAYGRNFYAGFSLKF